MTHTFCSPIGIVRLTEEDGAIARIELTDTADAHVSTTPTHLLREAEQQIMAYLEGKRQQLDFPIRIMGTPFQQRVWHALQQIPYGTTRTYGEIATAIGNPRASRAVGMACNKNPLLLIVPCHRVVGANGKLTGFAYGTDAKQWLLELEKPILLA
ncbi:MAG: methylated-DNA--[Bacteroidaceae bacterium]|nr:methylated-DNA--[protein]-cysteine S-methyltransferase [Bacteroidaceae bacterium]